jgi:ribosomal protein S14
MFSLLNLSKHSFYPSLSCRYCYRRFLFILEGFMLMLSRCLLLKRLRRFELPVQPRRERRANVKKYLDMRVLPLLLGRRLLSSHPLRNLHARHGYVPGQSPFRLLRCLLPLRCPSLEPRTRARLRLKNHCLASGVYAGWLRSLTWCVSALRKGLVNAVVH